MNVGIREQVIKPPVSATIEQIVLHSLGRGAALIATKDASHSGVRVRHKRINVAARHPSRAQDADSELFHDDPLRVQPAAVP
jgi:hypothetical protein